MTDEKEAGDEQVVGNRGPEVGVAVFLLAIGALVVADSLRVGIGWADDGPRSGYFPFYVGLFLIGSSGWTLLRALIGRSPLKGEFATREQIGLVFAVLVPMVVYVALIAGLGIYVASFLLISYFMKRHGKYGWPITAAVAAAVPIAFFLLFERWFLVLLPKGPLERALGF
ncbi:MAG: tripartite tricarboxylate transporter TctB family protein [Piscinibacter sp.]|uniref:tripartite tricarboxylate transporter TctB family protein n=1 Tax=Piscinibacter sp. TaxID=1903157 RepID=UPI003D0C5DB1